MAISLATLTALVIVMLIAANRRFAGDLRTVTGWRRFLIAVHLGVDALRVTPRAAGDVIYSGLAFQITQSAAVWMAAQALGIDEITFGVALAFFPVSAILQNLPIGIGGLGVREASFVFFFGAVGAPEGLCITLGLLVHLPDDRLVDLRSAVIPHGQPARTRGTETSAGQGGRTL